MHAERNTMNTIAAQNDMILLNMHQLHPVQMMHLFTQLQQSYKDAIHDCVMDSRVLQPTRGRITTNTGSYYNKHGGRITYNTGSYCADVTETTRVVQSRYELNEIYTPYNINLTLQDIIRMTQNPSSPCFTDIYAAVYTSKVVSILHYTTHTYIYIYTEYLVSDLTNDILTQEWILRTQTGERRTFIINAFLFLIRNHVA